MFRRKDPEAQPSLWIATSDLPVTPVNAFYRRLDEALAKAGFGEAVRRLCEPFYESDARRGGRPGVDPEVYFKMLMIGCNRSAPLTVWSRKCSEPGAMSIVEQLEAAGETLSPAVRAALVALETEKERCVARA